MVPGVGALAPTFGTLETGLQPLRILFLHLNSTREKGIGFWLQVFTLGVFPYFPSYDFLPFWFYLSACWILCAQGLPAFARSSLLHKETIDLNRIQICDTRNAF